MDRCLRASLSPWAFPARRQLYPIQLTLLVPSP